MWNSVPSFTTGEVLLQHMVAFESFHGNQSSRHLCSYSSPNIEGVVIIERDALVALVHHYREIIIRNFISGCMWDSVPRFTAIEFLLQHCF